MTSAKQTKSDLIERTKKLEKQLSKLKTRVDTQIFRRNKHANRLKNLVETAQGLDRRIQEIDDRLNTFAAEDRSKTDWQLALSARLDRLTEFGDTLAAGLHQVTDQIDQQAGQAPELRLENDSLRDQLRAVETHDSELSRQIDEHQSRLRESERQLAEMMQWQERQQQADDQPEPAGEQPWQALSTALREELSGLEHRVAEAIGLHKEAERRLSELANRSGNLGGEVVRLTERIDTRSRASEQSATQLSVLCGELEQKHEGLQQSQRELEEARLADTERLKRIESSLARVEALSGELQNDYRQLGERELGAGAGLDVLNARLQSQTERADNQEREIRELQQGQQQLTDQQQQQLTVVSDKQHELSGEMALISGELPALASKLESHKAASDDLCQRLALDLKAIQDDTGMQHQALQEHLNDLQRRMDASVERVEHLSGALPELTSTLESDRALGEAQRESIDTELQQFRDQLAQLDRTQQEHLNDLQRRMDASVERVERLSGALPELTSTLESDRALGEAQRESIDTELQQFRDQLAQLDRTKQENLDSLRDRVEQQTDQLQQLSREFPALAAALQTENTTSGQLEHRFGAEVNDLRQSLEAELNGLRYEIAQQKQLQLDAFEQQQNRLRLQADDIQRFTSEMPALASGLGNNQTELETFHQQLAAVQDELSRQQQKHLVDLESLRNALQQQSESVQQLADQLPPAASAQVRDRDSIDELRRQFGSELREIEHALGQQQQTQQADLESLVSRLEQQSDEFRELKAELPLLTSHLESERRAQEQSESTRLADLAAIRDELARQWQTQRENTERLQSELREQSGSVEWLAAELPRLNTRLDGERTSQEKQQADLAQDLSVLRADVTRQQEAQQAYLEQLQTELQRRSDTVEQLAQALPELNAQRERGQSSVAALEQQLQQIKKREKSTRRRLDRLDDNAARELARQTANEPAIAAQAQEILGLQGRLDRLDQEAPGRREVIDSLRAHSRRNSWGLLGLLLLALVAGAWLSTQLDNRLVQSQDQLTQALDSRTERYATKPDIAAIQRDLSVLSVKAEANVRETAATIERDLVRLQGEIERLQAGTSLAKAEPVQLVQPAQPVQLVQPVQPVQKEYQQRLMSVEQALNEVRGRNQALDNRSTQERKSILAQQQQLNQRIRSLDNRLEGLATKVPAVAWEKAAQAGSYTLQLAGSHRRKDVLDFARRYPSKLPRAIVRTQRQGRDWYTLLHGRFAQQQEAAEVLDSLPDGLRRYAPWIRRIPTKGKFDAL